MQLNQLHNVGQSYDDVLDGLSFLRYTVFEYQTAFKAHALARGEWGSFLTAHQHIIYPFSAINGG